MRNTHIYIQKWSVLAIMGEFLLRQSLVSALFVRLIESVFVRGFGTSDDLFLSAFDMKSLLR